MSSAARLTRTPSETRRLGERIGKMLRAGDVVLLSGELGAGKTVLAQGIGRGMGVTDPIKSSSFVIMNEYDGRELRLFHADLYRLEDPQQVAELALDELASRGVLVVEWPERAEAEMPAEHLRVTLAYDGARRRTVEVAGRGERYEAMAGPLQPRQRTSWKELFGYPADLPGYHWRYFSRADARSIRELAATCDAADGTLDGTGENAGGGSLVGLDGEDAIIAALYVDWAPLGEWRYEIAPLVHPSHRSWAMYDALVSWIVDSRIKPCCEDCDRAIKWLRVARVLPPKGSLPGETVQVYERLGLALYYVEHEMCAVVSASPSDATDVAGVSLVHWSSVYAAALRDAYNESFRDREFAGYSEDGWRDDFLKHASHDERLSLVALDGREVVGFALVEAENASPWFDTLGVRPAYRGRGIATALMQRAMAAMRDAGFERAALRVNEDNEPARRLYEKLGFETVKKHVVYRKRLTANR